MLNVEKYQQVLSEQFYLDSDYEVRRATDGYLKRFSKGDLATFHEGTGGYLTILIPFTRTQVRKSHLVLFLYNGTILKPNEQIDHKDGNRKNDTPENLRVVTNYLNSRNRKKRSDNTTGITGITWITPKQCYVIRRTIGKIRKVRSTRTLEEAILILEELKKESTEYTSRHGM